MQSDQGPGAAVVPEGSTHAVMVRFEFDDGGEPEDSVICFGQEKECEAIAVETGARSQHGPEWSRSRIGRTTMFPADLDAKTHPCRFCRRVGRHEYVWGVGYVCDEDGCAECCDEVCRELDDGDEPRGGF